MTESRLAWPHRAQRRGPVLWCWFCWATSRCHEIQAGQKQRAHSPSSCYGHRMRVLCLQLFTPQVWVRPKLRQTRFKGFYRIIIQDDFDFRLESKTRESSNIILTNKSLYSQLWLYCKINKAGKTTTVVAKLALNSCWTRLEIIVSSLNSKHGS